MIKLKINPLSSKTKDIEFIEGQTIEDIVIRAGWEYNMPYEVFSKVASVRLDNQVIEKESFPLIKPKENAEVLITIIPKGGDTFRTVLTIGVLAASLYVSGGASGAFVVGGKVTATGYLLGAGIGVAGMLAVNALVPPKSPTVSSSVNSRSGRDSSQMYSISGQSNNFQKYSIVPKVYGTHKMFPNIAANPYLTIGTDGKGKTVQFFHAIYDFGLGPNYVNEIKIGDTDIGDFNDVQYRLVDLNKPVVSEGDWDDTLNSAFELYKGDNISTNLSLVLNEDGDSVIFNAPANPNSYVTEYELFFSFPNGLRTIDNAGNSLDRSVEYKIEIADEGTDSWRAYNDNTVVYGGVSSDDDPIALGFYPPESENIPRTANGSNRDFLINTNSNMRPAGNSDYEANDFLEEFRNEGDIFPVGVYPVQVVSQGYFVNDVNRLFLRLDRQVALNEPVYINGSFIGFIINNSFEDNIHEISRTSYNLNIRFLEDYFTIKDGEPYYYYRDFLGEKGPRGNPTVVIGGQSGSDTLRVTSSSDSAYLTSVKIRPITTTPQKFRITRVRSYSPITNFFEAIDNMTCNLLNTRFDNNPIATNLRHTFLEIRIKATDQINGTVNNLSGVVTSVLDTYNGTAWEKKPTDNPAWIFTDMLIGQVNKRAITKSQIDVNSLYEWSQNCDEFPVSFDPLRPYTYNRFKCGFVLDFETTLKEILEQVSSSANASLSIVDGKYGVLIDREKTTPVQLITNRNSWGFSSERSYPDLPHAVNIKYIDPTNNWEINTVTVYYDGFNEVTATKFEEFDAFSCTNSEQAFRYGRYLIAQSILRKEKVSLVMDFENLVATRGDLVYYQQDVMKMGGQPARVKTVSGNRITINDSFVDGGDSYGYTFRSSNGDIYTDTLTIIDSETADLNGNIPGVGDLLVWGMVDSITTEWLVKTISPNDDMSAQLDLVEYNSAIYTSESDEFIAAYNPNLSNSLDQIVGIPDLVKDLTIVDENWTCRNGGYFYYIDIAWTQPDSIYESFDLYSNINGNGYELVLNLTENNYRYEVDATNLNLNHDFKVLALSATGKKKELSEAIEVSVTPVGKTELPSDVDDLYINVTSETLYLSWDLVADCDVQDYLIRYSPETTGATWERSSPLTSVNENTSFAMTQARTGTYFIKVRDNLGQESANTAQAITSIPELFNLNIIDEIEDIGFTAGTRDRVDFIGDSLVLREKDAVVPAEYEPEGFYYYSNFLDLGDVFTVRLQAKIISGGFSNGDLMINWPTLDSVASLSEAAGADYSVDIEYRARDSFNTIAEWDVLEDVVTMSEGESGDWTSWRRLVNGDFTGRVFQFRIRLRSFKPNISPQVFEAKVIADMPDRTITVNNLNCPVNGFRVTFDPEFNGPSVPYIQITQDDADQNDYYTITNKDTTGFDIEFFNGGSSVARQFDYQAKGYGRKYTTTI